MRDAGHGGTVPAVHVRAEHGPSGGEAVDLAVAVPADLNDPVQVTELTERCEAGTRALIAAVCRRSGTELTSFTAGETAARIRDERRASAWRRLSASGEAQAEADAVYDMVVLSPRGHEAALTAAEKARERTARQLLEQKLGQLRVLRMGFNMSAEPT